jgi:DNA-directed RNA polymerase beta subunit
LPSNSLSSKNVHNFSKLEEVVDIPDLLAIQVDSMENFFQEDVLPEKRENIGLESVFRNIFPIEDNHKNYFLEYKYYYLGIPRYCILLMKMIDLSTFKALSRMYFLVTFRT